VCVSAKKKWPYKRASFDGDGQYIENLAWSEMWPCKKGTTLKMKLSSVSVFEHIHIEIKRNFI